MGFISARSADHRLATRAAEPRAPFAFLRTAWADWRAGRELRSSLTAPESWLLSALGGGLAKSGATVNDHTAFTVSAVSACVNVLAQGVAMLPLKLYRRTSTGAEEATDHPLYHLLKRKPGTSQTSYQWRGYMQACLGLGGNAYSRIHRNAYAEVERIEWLRPSDIGGIERHTRTGALAYRLHGERELVPDHGILHLRGLSTDGVRGRSPLADLRESVGLALTAQEFSARTFANGNRKPGVLVGGQTMTKARADEFLAFWMQHYAGAANAGKSPLLFGGMEWRDAGFSNADAELLLTRKFEVEEIARVYRVPLTLLQSMEKSTSFGTGIAELNRGYVTHTLTPWLVNWEMELEDKLLTEAEKAAGMFIKFNVGALLRGSPLEQAQKAEIERRARLRTANEYRAEQDLNEFPDTGANNLEWPLNAQESGQQSAPAPAPEPDPALERTAFLADIDRAVRAAAPAPAPIIHVAAPEVRVPEQPIALSLDLRPPAPAAPAPLELTIRRDPATGVITARTVTPPV